MNNEQPDHSQLLSYIIPGWWLNAIRAANLRGFNRACELEKASRQGLLPHLTDGELDLLLEVVSKFRAYTFQGNFHLPCSISQRSIFNNLSPKSRRDTQKMERLYFQFESLKIFAQNSQNEGSSLLPLAELSEQKIVEESRDLRSSFLIGELSQELILGVIDLRSQWLREAQDDKNQVIRTLFNKEKGLCSVRRSLWMDLSRTERLFYLNLFDVINENFEQERSAISVDLDKLIGDISLKQSSTRAETESFKHLKIFKLFFNKLYNHGMISRFQGTSGEVDNQPKQLSSMPRVVIYPHQLHSECSSLNIHVKAAKKMFLGRLSKSHSLPSMHSNTSLKDQATSFTSKLLSSLDILREDDNLWHIGPSQQPIMLLFVYLEWIARRWPNHPKPLPEPARYLVRGLDPFEGKYEKPEHYYNFLYLVKQNKEIQFSIINDPDYFLLKNISLLDSQPACLRTKVSKDTTQTTQYKESKDALVHSKKPLPQRDNSPPRVKKVRLMAKQHLDRLLKFERPAYETLERKYIDSLDTHSRSLVLEIKKKMRDTDFKEHLKDRLLEYLSHSNLNDHSSTKTVAQEPD